MGYWVGGMVGIKRWYWKRYDGDKVVVLGERWSGQNGGLGRRWRGNCAGDRHPYIKYELSAVKFFWSETYVNYISALYDVSFSME